MFVLEYKEGEAQSSRTKEGNRLSYEDQLYLWCLLLKNNIAGKVSPAVRSGPGARAPVRYELLVDETNAAAMINSLSDLEPISPRQLRVIVKQFAHLDPPYPSFPPELHRKEKRLRVLEAV